MRLIRIKSRCCNGKRIGNRPGWWARGWIIELRLHGWIGGRVTRVEGGDPCAWDEIDWLAHSINRLVGYCVDLVFIPPSIVLCFFFFQDLEILHQTLGLDKA